MKITTWADLPEPPKDTPVYKLWYDLTGGAIASWEDYAADPDTFFTDFLVQKAHELAHIKRITKIYLHTQAGGRFVGDDPGSRIPTRKYNHWLRRAKYVKVEQKKLG